MCYVDNSGVHLSGNVFAIGSGSAFALGFVDACASKVKSLKDLSMQEGIALAMRALRSAKLRDACSGGYIHVCIITKKDG